MTDGRSNTRATGSRNRHGVLALHPWRAAGGMHALEKEGQSRSSSNNRFAPVSTTA